MQTETPAPKPTDAPTTYVNDEGCVDLSEFEDYFGDNCKVCAFLLGLLSSRYTYDSHQSNLSQTVHYSGTKSMTILYVRVSPIVLVHDECINFPNPHCFHFSSFSVWGSHQGGPGFEDFTAKTACCYCGGGFSRDGPTGNETIAPGVEKSDFEPSVPPSPTSVPVSNGTNSAAGMGTKSISSTITTTTSRILLVSITLALILGKLIV